MNIEIDYNPAIPLTSLKINNNPDDTIYGALFPVRRYPLQSWINKNGAWGGLSKVLHDITRGRRFTLTFVGREMDFEDLKISLSDLNAELLHTPAYENDDERSFVENILRELRFLSDYPHKDFSEKAKSIMNSTVDIKRFEFTSTTQVEELLQVLKTSRSLVLIHTEVFSEIFETVQKHLYGNFTRPAESVAVKAANEVEAERYSPVRECGLKIVLSDDCTIDTLTEKYSVSEAIGGEYRRLWRLAEFMDELMRRKESLRKLNSEIRDDYKETMDKEYTQDADEIRWIKRNESALKKAKALIFEKTEGVS